LEKNCNVSAATVMDSPAIKPLVGIKNPERGNTFKLNLSNSGLVVVDSAGR
jgi:hypothetical protein